MDISRRDFIRTSTGAALAGSLLSSLPVMASKEEPKKKPELLPMVDTHQHLWDLTKFRLPWVKSSAKLNRSYLTEDYLQATKGLHVVKAVYMEVAVDPSQLRAEAEHVIELCKRRDNPTCAAVIGGRPAADNFREYMLRFKGDRYVKGIRQVLFSDAGLCLTEKYVEGVRLLGELGLSFDICLPPDRLEEGVKLVGLCPDTRFIVDHCGNADPKAFRPRRGTDEGPTRAPPSHDPDEWRKDMATLAKARNVVCKISGIVARAPEESWGPEDLAPIIDHCLEVFGPDRVMFGSDWPVCTRVATLRDWVKALKEIISSRGEVERRKLLHDNAVKFYGLV